MQIPRHHRIRACSFGTSQEFVVTLSTMNRVNDPVQFAGGQLGCLYQSGFIPGTDLAHLHNRDRGSTNLLQGGDFFHKHIVTQQGRELASVPWLRLLAVLIITRIWMEVGRRLPVDALLLE